MNKCQCFFAEVNSNVDSAITKMYEVLTEWLVSKNSTKEIDPFFFEFGIKEAVNNSFEHAKSNLFFKIRCSDESVHIHFKDLGAGFDYKSLLDKYLSYEDIDQIFEDKLYDTRGRGIPLMLKIFNEVKYSNNGTELILKLKTESQ